MKWISGLKPSFKNQVQTQKWKTQKLEAEFQVYFNIFWYDVIEYFRFLI